jgi:hypothetical protein
MILLDKLFTDSGHKFPGDQLFGSLGLRGGDQGDEGQPVRVDLSEQSHLFVGGKSLHILRAEFTPTGGKD